MVARRCASLRRVKYTYIIRNIVDSCRVLPSFHAKSDVSIDRKNIDSGGLGKSREAERRKRRESDDWDEADADADAA